MGFASKVFFLLGLAAAVAALPVEAGAAPAAGGAPTVAQVKRALGVGLRCSWGEDAKVLRCDTHVKCDVSVDFFKSPHGDRVVRAEIAAAVRYYAPPDPRHERRNFACVMKVIDLYFPTWRGRRAWFSLAVSRVLEGDGVSARRVGGGRITVQGGGSNVPAAYVLVTVE